MIVLGEVKYGVENHNGILKTFRYGKHWKEKDQDYIGDGFVLSLVERIEELEHDLMLEQIKNDRSLQM